MSYFYARKVEFVGKDGKTYYWFYKCDSEGGSLGIMDQVFSYELDKLGFDCEFVKRSKIIEVKDTESNRNKLMVLCCGKKSVKKRFFEFLHDERIFHMYFMNWKNSEDYKEIKINNAQYYISFAFQFNKCLYGDSAFWYKIHRKWNEILKNEGYK